MLVLPTGQVLYTDGSQDVEIYTPSGSANPNWAPTVSLFTASLQRGTSVLLYGTKFNGLSQANAYGDDAQMATNYPIVKLTNESTRHVIYARTHDHSTMAVGYTGPTYTHVDLPPNMERGLTLLQVIANGIASQTYTVGIH